MIRTKLHLVLSLAFFPALFTIMLFGNQPVRAKEIAPVQELNGAVTDCTLITEISQSECDGLVALFYSTNGPSWIDKTGWLVTDTPCSWFGVTCDESTPKKVNNIYIRNNSLSGPIPGEIGNLVNLTELNLGNNVLSGSIPTQIGSLINLTSLNLVDNQLSGSIPNSIGQLTKLTSLELTFNDLTGQLPEGLFQLSNLSKLFLGVNELEGDIPSVFNQLLKMENLDLSHNKFGNSIPAEIAELPNLISLVIRGNNLTGLIPSSIGGLSQLGWLDLSDNQLTGEIPSEIGELTNLRELSLGGNFLSGSIPVEIGSLQNLSTLVLRNNDLTGEIPKEILSLANFNTRLDLSYNELSGSIPSELGQLTTLYSLHLSNNQLTGEIPAELNGMVTLRELFLDNNQLTGSIPATIGDMDSLRVLSLDHNQLTGNLPSQFGDMDSLEYLYIQSNLMKGELPLALINFPNLVGFSYNETGLCAPRDASFQDWLASISYTGTWNCLATPTKTSPISNAFTKDTTPKFTWQKQMDGEKYQILVDNDSDFASPVLQATGLVNPYKTFTTTLVQGAFYWKVRAKDPGGNWSPWSTKWKFTVDTTAPGKPILVSPVNESKTTDRTPTFTWKAVTGAKYYQLVVDNNADFSSPVYTSPWGTTVSKTLGTALAPKPYYWKVRAKDAAGNISPWSGAWKLTIK